MHHLIVRSMKGIGIALVATAGLAQNARHPSQAPISIAKPSPGYLVSSFTLRDQTAIEQHLDSIRLMTTRYKGKAIAFNVSAPSSKGAPQPVTAVLEFPSLADAERFYFSPEYAEVRRLPGAQTGGPIVLSPTSATTRQQKNHFLNRQHPP